MVVIVRISVRGLLLSVMEQRIVVAIHLRAIPKVVCLVVPLMVAVLIILERVLLIVIVDVSLQDLALSICRRQHAIFVGVLCNRVVQVLV